MFNRDNIVLFAIAIVFCLVLLVYSFYGIKVCSKGSSSIANFAIINTLLIVFGIIFILACFGRYYYKKYREQVSNNLIVASKREEKLSVEEDNISEPVNIEDFEKDDESVIEIVDNEEEIEALAENELFENMKMLSCKEGAEGIFQEISSNTSKLGWKLHREGKDLETSQIIAEHIMMEDKFEKNLDEDLFALLGWSKFGVSIGWSTREKWITSRKK